MSRPVSNEIRERIIIHKQSGVSEKTIAKWLIVSQSTVTKVWALYRKSGSYKPLPPKSGRKPLVSDATMKSVMTKIKETPDITLCELIDVFSLPFSAAALSKRLKKLGLTFKKRHAIPKLNGEKML